MNIKTLQSIVDELSEKLSDSCFGRVFQVSGHRIVIEFAAEFTRYLLIDSSPTNPVLYLTNARLRDLKKAEIHPSPFTQALRQNLSGLRLTAISLLPNERVVKMDFAAFATEMNGSSFALMVQLTGRSSNMFLLDNGGIILSRERRTHGAGQLLGDIYSPPSRPEGLPEAQDGPIDWLAADSRVAPSESIDKYLAEREGEDSFLALSRRVISKLRSDRKKIEKKIVKLSQDLRDHGDADTLKRTGDLLLANASTARRDGSKVFLVDYFDPEMSEVEVEIEQNEGLAQAAERAYKRSTKARNAVAEIATRTEKLENDLRSIDAAIESAEKATADHDEAALASFLTGSNVTAKIRGNAKTDPVDSVSRKFISSDGYEIRVGKRAKDNDTLTFKMARSLDLWLHAADYPGSHVIVRNPNRGDIPERTLIEAAKLAAFYSRGSSQPNAAVHYTQKKFVNKPKGSAPGLVSLAKFKTILVEPERPRTSPENRS